MAGRLQRSIVAVLALAGAALLLLPAGAGAKHDHRKVFTFVIDGLDPEALGSAPFISSLIAGGEGARTTFFPNSRSVMFAETNPNHTAMMTGAYGNRSGVNSNEYALYEEIPDEDSCALPGATRTQEPNVTAGEDNTCLLVPTVMETIERRKNPKHISTAIVSGKPKLANLFATSNVYGEDRYDADHLWTPCGSNNAPYCEDVPTQPITNYSAADSYPMDEVIRITEEGVLDTGKMRKPDYTFVNLPQVDSAGHVFGRSSAEYIAAIGLADQEIQRFVNSQKSIGQWQRTVMMIVSDHGMRDTPNISKVRISDILDAADVPEEGYKIAANAGSQAHIYLTNRQDPARFALLKQMRDALIAAPNVAEALYRQKNPADGGKANTVRGQHREWKLWGPRAGDLMVTSVGGTGIYETSEASSVPFNPFEGGHGNVETADNTFLITGGHKSLKQGNSNADAPNVDVGATAMKLLSRKPSKHVKGDFRREAFKLKQLKKGF